MPDSILAVFADVHANLEALQAVVADMDAQAISQRVCLGDIVVAPRGGETVRTAADHVFVLSDWTDERPGEVMRSLMRRSDYYAIRKGTKQSILGAAQAGKLPEYFRREWSRVPPMDISDVAEEARLQLAHREWIPDPQVRVEARSSPRDR